MALAAAFGAFAHGSPATVPFCEETVEAVAKSNNSQPRSMLVNDRKITTIAVREENRLREHDLGQGAATVLHVNFCWSLTKRETEGTQSSGSLG